MFARKPSKSSRRRVPPRTAVDKETLLMLSAVLRTAFRLHCTGETVAGHGPWQLIAGVQNKLAELGPGTGVPISEERLARYVEDALAPPQPTLKLVETA
jgi:hypothetical protein